MSEVQKYSKLAMSLHWIMALLILAMFCLGWYMEDLPKGSDERSYFFKLHKNIGMTLFLLLILRIICAVIDKRPGLPNSLASWQRKLATATHHSLYLFMILQPLTGFISSSFTKYKTSFWGVIDLPRIFEPSKEWNDFFTEVHEICSVVLLVLILIHLAGALAFLVSKHENVLRRMLPVK